MNKQAKFKQPKLGIVTPLANEENTIEEQISRTLKQISDQDQIFYILDNTSKDSTKEKIIQAAKKDPRITLIWAPENRSVVDAYFKGYEEALNNNCEWILEMDGGLSHQPEEIPSFIEKMRDGFDFAGGSRFSKSGKYINPGKRYILSKGGTILTNLMLKTKMKDMTSGFECFSKKALKHVLEKGVESKGHFFQTEIRYMMHDFKWTEVPITYSNPSKSVKNTIIFEALRILWRLRCNSKN